MKKLMALMLTGVMVAGLAACGSSSSATSSAASSAAAESAASSAAAEEETEAVSAASGEAAAEEEAAPAGETELTFWYWADTPENSATIQKAVADFNATNGKGITVKAEEYPWNSGGFMEDTFTAMQGGGGPDMSTFKVSSTSLYAANGLLADMSEYVDAWEDKGQISDAAWDIMKDATGDGTISVLPWTLEPLYVYYRPSYFEKAGVEVPTTIEEFLDVCEKCTMDTDGDGTTDIYGYGMRGAAGGHEHLGNFLYAYGASWDDLTTPEAVEAYKAYLSIYENGWAPEASVNAAYAEISDMFATGQAAMIIHHIGSSTTWLDTFGDDVDAFVFPGSDKGQWTCTGDTEIAVYEQCENKEAAFEFYKYMTTGEGGTTWFKDTGKGLGTENVTSTEEFAANKFQAISAEAQQVAGVLPSTETVSEFINNVWAPTNQAALLGQMSAEDALAEMNAALHG